VGQVSSQVLAAVGSTIKNVQTCIIKIKNFISPDTFLSGFPPKKERQEMCEKPRKTVLKTVLNQLFTRHFSNPSGHPRAI